MEKNTKQVLTEERVREIIEEEIAKRLAEDGEFAMRIMRHFRPSQITETKTPESTSHYTTKGESMTTYGFPTAWDYRGFRIVLLADGRFGAEGVEDTINRDSLAGAKAGVDKHLAGIALESRAALSLKSLTNDGTPVTVTGINRRSGELLYTPKRRRGERETEPRYVDHPKVRALILSKEKAKEVFHALQERLEIASFKRMGYQAYKASSDTDYPAKIAMLKADYQRALETADVLEAP